jgi:hypothetical protein
VVGGVWLASTIATSRADDSAADVAKLKAEIEQLRGLLPSQSHSCPPGELAAEPQTLIQPRSNA